MRIWKNHNPILCLNTELFSEAVSWRRQLALLRKKLQCDYKCVYACVYKYTYIFFLPQPLPKGSCSHLAEQQNSGSLGMWRPGDAYHSGPHSFNLNSVILRPIMRLFSWILNFQYIAISQENQSVTCGKLIILDSFSLEKEMSNNLYLLTLSHILEINLPWLFAFSLPVPLSEDLGSRDHSEHGLRPRESLYSEGKTMKGTWSWHQLFLPISLGCWPEGSLRRSFKRLRKSVTLMNIWCGDGVPCQTNNYPCCCCFVSSN